MTARIGRPRHGDHEYILHTGTVLHPSPRVSPWWWLHAHKTLR